MDPSRKAVCGLGWLALAGLIGWWALQALTTAQDLTNAWGAIAGLSPFRQFGAIAFAVLTGIGLLLIIAAIKDHLRGPDPVTDALAWLRKHTVFLWKDGKRLRMTLASAFYDLRLRLQAPNKAGPEGMEPFGLSDYDFTHDWIQLEWDGSRKGAPRRERQAKAFMDSMLTDLERHGLIEDCTHHNYAMRRWIRGPNAEEAWRRIAKDKSLMKPLSPSAPHIPELPS